MFGIVVAGSLLLEDLNVVAAVRRREIANARARRTNVAGTVRVFSPTVFHVNWGKRGRVGRRRVVGENHARTVVSDLGTRHALGQIEAKIRVAARHRKIK